MPILFPRLNGGFLPGLLLAGTLLIEVALAGEDRDRPGGDGLKGSQVPGAAAGDTEGMEESALASQTASTEMARGPVPAAPSQYMVRAWPGEALPHPTVKTLVQTRDGYLWIGTRKGLVRFDGVRFVVFDTANTPELKDASIMALCESRDGSLWIGTESAGLVRMQEGKFTRFIEGGLKIKVIQEIKDGSLIIGLLEGAVRYKDGKFGEIRDDLEITGVVRTLAGDREGNIWLPTLEVRRFKPEGGPIKLYTKEHGLTGTIYRALMQDSTGAMWLGSDHGVANLRDNKTETYTTKEGLAHNFVAALHEDRAGNIWVGSYGGLNRIAQGKIYSQLNNAGEAFDFVYAICGDADGNIWVGSKDGLFQLRPRQVTVYTRREGLSFNNVMSVLEDRRGTIWATTWGGGLNRLKQDRFIPYQAESLTGMELFLALYEDTDGTLWTSADFGGGLYRLTEGELGHLRFKDAAIRVIYRDSRSQLWLGTNRFLCRFEPGAEIRFDRTNGLAGDNVRALLEDHRHDLWVGTSEGLSRLSDGKITNFSKAQGLSNENIGSFYEDRERTLWIGTNGGLNRFRDGKFRAFTTADGLWHDTIAEILEDDAGNLWMSSSNGIFRVSKKNLEDFDRGLVPTLSCTAYGKDEGMVGIDAHNASKPAGWKSRDGRLWFATTKGLAVVDPRDSLKDNPVPRVKVEEVLVDKKPVASTSVAHEVLRIPPSAGELEFHYTALSLRAPEKNRFKYKLEGVDADWVDAGPRRVAYYNHIGPGEYRFRVIASNHDKVWNETGASFSFRLLPHFYQTGWFYLGCTVSGAGLLLGLYRWNVRKLKQRQEQLEALVGERTKYLQAEIAERMRMQAEMEETHRQLVMVSRKAGMAEVASGVLHNVGNVLNSVNVSSSLVVKHLRDSRHSMLKKVAEMVRSQASGLAAFFATEKGKQIPDYLEKLADHMTHEHEATIKELALLTKNIEHIKEIVSMQQKYAKVSAMTESVKVSDMVEDALRMNATSLDRHQHQVRREFFDDPVVPTDKHKVLQILVNLIRNAQHACDESGKEEKQLTLRTTLNGAFVRISVIDNGVGIPAENLTRIFSHGFTTRNDGHGFGLHSSAIAASDLGGSLAAQSAGPGHGATFVLEIPLVPKEAKPKPKAG